MAATDTTSKTISQSLLTYILTKIKSFIPTNISELNNDKNYVTSDSVTTSLATKQDKLTFDTTPTTSSKNPVTSDGIKKAIDAKTVDLSGYQTKLTFDTTPTAGSTNPVTSAGIKTALNAKLDATSNAASATKATQDANGNVITTTYATKTEVNTKQNALTFDTIPTANSTNPVTSNGVKMALDGKLSTSGNAASASKLATTRTISVSGDVTGSGSFNGSSDLTITTTCAQATKALNIPTSDVGGNIWIA